MAQAENQNRRKDDPRPTSQSLAGFLMAVAIAVLIGIAGGGAFGYFVAPAGPQSATSSAVAEAEPPTPLPGRFPDDALELPLAPIIVELATEPRTRVRLDLSLIAAHGTPEGSALKSEVREDVIAFLKGLSLADIQGVRGFQNLREQLDDRAKIRGRGAILGLLIGGLVLE